MSWVRMMSGAELWEKLKNKERLIEEVEDRAMFLRAQAEGLDNLAHDLRERVCLIKDEIDRREKDEG